MKHLSAILWLFIVPFYVNGQFQEQSDNSLRVAGVYITKEIPEMVELNLKVSYTNMDYSTCSDSLLIITGKVSDRFIENGITKEKIRIAGIALNENYTYESGTRVKNGFVGNTKIEIRDSYSQNFVESIFKSIGSLEFTIDYNVSFSLSEPQKEKLRRLSLEKAIIDAKEKAELIAEQNNLKLVKINRVDFQDNAGFWDNEYDLAFEEELIPITRREDIYSNIELNPKEISIVKTVQIEWIIRETE